MKTPNRALLLDLIESVIEENNPGLTDDQLTEALQDGIQIERAMQDIREELESL